MKGYNGIQSHLRKASSRWSRGRPTGRPVNFIKVGGILTCVTVFTYVIVNSRLQSLNSMTPRTFLRGNVIEEPTCKLPVLAVNNPDILKHMREVPPIRCTDDDAHEEDWVWVNGTHAQVTKEALANYKRIKCEFSPITRVSDVLSSKSMNVETGLVYEFRESDFVYVSCKARGKKWSSYLAAPRTTVNIPVQKYKTFENAKRGPVNVLIWGHDSLSRNMFIRKLPRSFKYLTQTLGGIILQGYNIVGDGTPQALIPILTGKTELELPETRKRKGSAAQHVNVYPFVWKEFKAKGYLTGYMEDCPGIGTFTYRLKGFDAEPTDYYMRPYFVSAERSYKKYMKYCIGSIPRHKIMMNYVKHILERNRQVPKFLFSFHSELSHSDMNAVQGADKDLVSFLKGLNGTGALENTVLIVMSDHGSRFSIIRESEQGKQEERMPMMMFVFPSWFKKSYPVAFENFKKNSHILSTPFDIHPTLLDLAHLPVLNAEYFSKPNSKKERSLSLFRPVPPDRTCRDASIEPHWCACLQWQVLNTSLSEVRRAAQEFVDYVNHYVQNQTALCAPLQLNRIVSAANLSPADELLRFKQSADMDGFKPDLSDTMTLSRSTIQLKLETVPGEGLFEVSLSHDLTKNTFEIDLDEVSRINQYGRQAACTEESLLEHLRKYCYCKDNR